MVGLILAVSCPKSVWPAVEAMLHSVFEQPDAPAVVAQFDRFIDYVIDKLPDVAVQLVCAPEDILAFSSLCEELWQQIWFNNPTSA